MDSIYNGLKFFLDTNEYKYEVLYDDVFNKVYCSDENGYYFYIEMIKGFPWTKEDPLYGRYAVTYDIGNNVYMTYTFTDIKNCVDFIISEIKKSYIHKFKNTYYGKNFVTFKDIKKQLDNYRKILKNAETKIKSKAPINGDKKLYNIGHMNLILKELCLKKELFEVQEKLGENKPNCDEYNNLEDYSKIREFLQEVFRPDRINDNISHYDSLETEGGVPLFDINDHSLPLDVKIVNGNYQLEPDLWVGFVTHIRHLHEISRKRGIDPALKIEIGDINIHPDDSCYLGELISEGYIEATNLLSKFPSSLIEWLIQVKILRLV